MLTAGAFVSASAFLLAAIASIYGQRITTIQLDGVQYFISRMNPYSPELNYFLAYQYCRSIGLQLASFESQEKADSMMQYLRNAGYNGHDYWTSGNRLGNDMMIWMSSGVTFNVTFNYMRKSPSNELDHSTTNGPGSEDPLPADSSPNGQAKNPNARRGWRRQSREGYLKSGCVALKAPELEWDTDDCDALKDFICEQTRCYYYNYGSIPVSTAQGNNKKKQSLTTTTAASIDTTNNASTTHKPPLASNDYHQDQEEEDYPQLGPLLNFTVNRRITLRPSVGDQTTPTTTTTAETPSILDASETPVEGQSGRTFKKDVSTQSQEGFSGRSIFSKDTDTNVVYVTAVGASDDQQAIAYLNTDASSTDLPTTQTQEDESDHTVTGNPDASALGTHGKVLDPLPINKYIQDHKGNVPSHVY